jgi:hypothetical protein
MPFTKEDWVEITYFEGPDQEDHFAWDSEIDLARVSPLQIKYWKLP